MKKQLKHGDQVLVVNTLNYNGRRGVLGPISDDPEDIWDYTVELSPGMGDDRLAEARKIGVHEGQVLPLSLSSLKGTQLNVVLSTLSEEGIQNVISGALTVLGVATIRSDEFLEAKMIIQQSLHSWVEINPEVKPILTTWQLLGGKSGTLSGYVEAVTRLALTLARVEASTHNSSN